MKAAATAGARKIEPGASAPVGGVKQMKKTTILLAAAMFAAATGSAFAGWVAQQLGDPQITTVYTAETAGKSGNVKACFSATQTITTYQWTQSQTGATRGTFDVTTTTDQVQVDNSLCEPA